MTNYIRLGSQSVSQPATLRHGWCGHGTEFCAHTHTHRGTGHTRARRGACIVGCVCSLSAGCETLATSGLTRNTGATMGGKATRRHSRYMYVGKGTPNIFF